MSGKEMDGAVNLKLSLSFRPFVFHMFDFTYCQFPNKKERERERKAELKAGKLSGMRVVRMHVFAFAR